MPLTTWWLVAAVVLAPLAAFPGSSGIGLAQAKNALVVVFGLGLIVWRLPSVWAQAFAALALLSFMAAVMTVWALAGVLGVFAWLLVYAEAARLSDAGWRAIRWAMAGAALFQIAWMGLQALGLDPVFRPLSYRGDPLPGPAPVVGWFSNPMDTAVFLGLSLPAAAALSPWLLLPGALALWTLGSTAGIVCLAVTACWIVPGWRWRATTAVVLVAGGLAFSLVRDPQGMGLRPAIWRNAAQLAWARPVLGWGPNGVGYRLRTIHPRTVEHWDFYFCEWLQGAVELGLAGPALALGYLASLAWRLRRRGHALGEALPGALALLALSTFSIPLRIGPAALLGALYLGRLEGLAREAQA